MPRKECIAMLLAGGQGSRLGCLTKRIAKPAVPFGGKYRIIDFSLSNCSNSGIDTVGVLTQYKPTLLNAYIGVGSAWDLDVSDGGVYVLPPYMGEQGGEWYKGTANAVYQHIDFIEHFSPEYVLVISGDHIYKMDYSLMLDYHRQKKADVTLAVIEVPKNETKRFGIVKTDENGRITEFKEKPAVTASTMASMGVYMFNWPVLKEYLLLDENDPTSDHDFGKNIIPRMLGERVNMYAYRFRGYWKDVGTIDSYYAANMDLLKRDPELDIFEDHLKVYSKPPVLPPHYLGPRAEVRRTLIPDGCVVLGEVYNSVLFPGVYIGEGSKVFDSIIMPKVKIGKGCLIIKTIIGENSLVGDECRIGSEGEDKNGENELTVIADSVILPGRAKVRKSSQIAGWRQSKIS